MIRFLIIATIFSLIIFLLSCTGRALINSDDDSTVRPPNINCDADGDGYTAVVCGGNDCNDSNPNIHPGAQEYCDGVDQNCNGIADDGCLPPPVICDADGDGYDDMDNPDCPGGTDCDDSNPYVYPGAQEYCDGTDGDCNGVIDNDCIAGLCNRPGVIFCDDFETGNFSRWNDLSGPNVAPEERIIEDQGPHGIGGNHVARLWARPGRGGAELRHYFNGAGQGKDKLYLRWYHRWENSQDNSHPEWNPDSGYGDDYDFSAANHGSGLYAIDESQPYSGAGYRPTGYDKFTGSLEPIGTTNPDLKGRLNIYSYYRGMYMDCANPNGGCWGDHFPCMFSNERCYIPEHRPPPWPPFMEAGRWYCLQIMLDGGTTGETGAQNFWIDGVEYGPWEDLWMRSSENLKIRMLHITLWHHGEHSNAGIRVDDVIASTEYIPCGPIGPIN